MSADDRCERYECCNCGHVTIIAPGPRGRPRLTDEERAQRYEEKKIKRRESYATAAAARGRTVRIWAPAEDDEERLRRKREKEAERRERLRVAKRARTYIFV